MERAGSSWNPKSPSVKRLMRELAELRASPSPDFHIEPLDDNLFEWHFTLRGPPDTVYEGGFYHGRMILPEEYPFKPPSFIFLTPSGRFEVGKKICLSISNYHPEHWQPSWGIQTAMVALVSMLPETDQGSIGAMNCPDEIRRRYAADSTSFSCPQCGKIKTEWASGIASSSSGPVEPVPFSILAPSSVSDGDADGVGDADADANANADADADGADNGLRGFVGSTISQPGVPLESTVIEDAPSASAVAASVSAAENPDVPVHLPVVSRASDSIAKVEQRIRILGALWAALFLARLYIF
eukprot:ANDGO_01060.mRNA.1 Ubiquitin-conjugating enzyme E2 32